MIMDFLKTAKTATQNSGFNFSVLATKETSLPLHFVAHQIRCKQQGSQNNNTLKEEHNKEVATSFTSNSCMPFGPTIYKRPSQININFVQILGIEFSKCIHFKHLHEFQLIYVFCLHNSFVEFFRINGW